MAAKVLFLYIKDQSEDAETLKDYLQAQLGTRVNLINIFDVLAEDCELHGALVESKCVVLVNSEKAARMIEKGEKEMDEGFIIFDGQVIRDFIHNERYLQKLLLVFLGEPFCHQWIPEGLDRRRVFTIAGDMQKEKPALDQIMDTIRSVVTHVP